MENSMENVQTDLRVKRVNRKIIKNEIIAVC